MGLPISRIETIADGTVDPCRVGYAGLGPDDARNWLLQDGDILFSHINSVEHIGKCALYEGNPPRLVHGMNLLCLRPIPTRIDPRYARWLIRSHEFRSRLANYVNKAVNQASVSISNLRSIKVTVPQIEEQRRIAAILDQAEALRAKRRQALAKLDTLTQSLFRDLMHGSLENPSSWLWPSIPFPEAVYFQEGPGIRNWQFRDDGVKLVNVKNIVNGRLDISNTTRFLDPTEVKKRYQHFLLDAGDFVMASSGVTWGKIAEVQSTHLPLCLNTSMIRIRPKDSRIHKAFLREFINSTAFRPQIERLITGSAQPNFGPAHLKQVKIPIPPKAIQQRFAQQISLMEDIGNKNDRSLELAESLSASLGRRAFRGEL